MKIGIGCRAVAVGLLAPLLAAAPARAANWVEITQDDVSAIYIDTDSIRPVAPLARTRNFPVVQASIKHIYRKLVGTEPLRDRIALESVDCKGRRNATLAFTEYKLLDGSVGRSMTRPDTGAIYKPHRQGSVSERLYRVMCGLDRVG